MSIGVPLIRLGSVLARGTRHPDTVKVRTVKMVLDKRLMKYFNSRKDYWALEQDVKCKVGDIVLIENYRPEERPDVNARIRENIFPAGKVVDPITGRRCRGKDFIDEEARKFEIENYYNFKTE